ncbi:MAG: ABC transporter ATP-binding protein [Candidatus Limnocylindrales bacterium]
MDGTVPAVDGVSFQVNRGETLGLVGESGCGKSVTALTIMRLIETPPGEIVGGEIWFNGRDVLQLSSNQMLEVRGAEMAMIFQEPMTSLNPVLTVGDQIAEAVLAHKKVSQKAAWDRAVEMLRLVGIPEAARRVKQYPHEMSGGMRQRVMIALALSCDPKLLIADEPTTALDVTIQAQILELIRRVQEETGTALLLITHDLGVVAETVQRIVVMYAGKIVETGAVDEVLQNPQHPYTEGLLASIPSKGMRGTRLNVIRGSVPNPFMMPSGCRFAPRCPYAFDPCRDHEPPLDDLGSGDRRVACWLHTRPPFGVEHRPRYGTATPLPVARAAAATGTAR